MLRLVFLFTPGKVTSDSDVLFSTVLGRIAPAQVGRDKCLRYNVFRSGDTVAFEGEITGKREEDGRQILECWLKGSNQSGELVCLSDATMVMYTIARYCRRKNLISTSSPYISPELDM